MTDTETDPAADVGTGTDLGPAIRARGLSKSYGGRSALSEVDLVVERGTMLGLLGPNGAGKTTLIRILTTVLNADRGSFTIAGVPSTDPITVRARVGLLPESAGLPAGETAAEILTFHAELCGSSRAEARSRADALLHLVGLADRAGSLVGGFSRGMRQRLGIARAFVADPDVVFLDEPTLGLDPAGQKQIIDYIAAVVREQGTTVVLSTHVLAEVEEICDRVVILNRGRIIAEGSTADVAERAAAPRRGRLTVPADRSSVAVARLADLAVVERAESERRSGDVRVELRAGVTADTAASELLAAMVAAGIPVLGFDLERGRLSDAFLELTARP
jgi:ABC-2 type transport system ATP-binding protein